MRLIPILHRPAFLSARNGLRSAFSGRFSANMELSMLLISGLVVAGVYFTFSMFLGQLAAQDFEGAAIARNIIHLSALALFVLLCLSSFLTTLSSFFTARDVPLLLTLPIKSRHFYLSRLLSSAAASSWMLVLFAAPAALAYYTTFQLPFCFLPVVLAAAAAFVLCAAALAGVCAVLVVNLIPAEELKQNLAFTAVITFVFIFSLTQFAAIVSPVERRQILEAQAGLLQWQETHLNWSPSYALAALVNSFLPGGSGHPLFFGLLLASQTLLLLVIGYLVFDRLHLRGVTLSAASRRRTAGPAQTGTRRTERMLRPFSQQFRALLLKEFRVFARDLPQCLQLALLLMLSLIYLYNFGSLRSVPKFAGEAKDWWTAVLAFTNLTLGSFVISAVTTRFVFPTVSLEASGISLIRSSPISLRSYLNRKFCVWFWPVSAVSLFLLLAGSAALGLTGPALLVCALYGISLSVGLVGLGVGIGAVYARFDWDHPAQVTASFGSLVYMLLSVMNIVAASLPLGVLLLLTVVREFSVELAPLRLLIFTIGSAVAVVGINVFSAIQALAAGANSLEHAE